MEHLAPYFIFQASIRAIERLLLLASSADQTLCRALDLECWRGQDRCLLNHWVRV
jgi:hypothetical protein